IGLVIFHQGLLPELAHPNVLRFTAVMMPPFAALLGILMVSRFRYYHVVNTVLRGRRPFWQVVSIAIVFLVGMVVQFQLTLAVATSAYALSGLLVAAYYKLVGRPQPQEPMIVTPPEDEALDDSDTFDEVDDEESSAANPSKDDIKSQDEQGGKTLRL